MKPDTRLAIRWSFAAASWVGCAIGGAKLWPKHPIAGGAIGVIVVAPAINAVVNAVLPKAEVPPSQPQSERPRANYTEVPVPVVAEGVSNSERDVDRAGNPIYSSRHTRGTQGIRL